jgi:hypothetical protein
MKLIQWILLAPFKLIAWWWRQNFLLRFLQGAVAQKATVETGVMVREYQSAKQYKISARRQARKGWRVTTATVERRTGVLFPLGGSSRYVVTYEKVREDAA